jgi:hypothetical protein
MSWSNAVASGGGISRQNDRHYESPLTLATRQDRAMNDDTLDYSHTLDALVGWIGSAIRATVHDCNENPLLVLNGELDRAPDSAEGQHESRFLCVGHDDARVGADGFFLPSETFLYGVHVDTPAGVEPRSALLIAFEGSSSLTIECVGPRHPHHS